MRRWGSRVARRHLKGNRSSSNGYFRVTLRKVTMPAKGSHTARRAGAPALSGPLPGARDALILLLCINLFNYIDRQMLAAVVPKIRGDLPAHLPASLQRLFGNPENALIGLLAMAFMVTYMLAAPLFGWLAERRPRWLLAGIGVIGWS